MTAIGDSGQVRTRLVLVIALVVAVVVVLTGGALAARRRAPLSAEADAQIRKAIVGFELSKASARPASMIGKKLTADDKAALQARFLRRLQRFAGGPELQHWQSWDYARGLLEDEWDARELTGCKGKVVYWDFRHRDAGGGVVVRAGVEQRYGVVTWDAATGRAVPHGDWVTGVSVNDYTLKQTDGVWKVFGSEHWRFYDPATRQLGTGP